MEKKVKYLSNTKPKYHVCSIFILREENSHLNHRIKRHVACVTLDLTESERHI